MKEQHHFDRLIKEKVANYSVPLTDGAWALFAEKQAEVAEADEDLLLDQKAALLNSFESPLNQHHWVLMAERIQKELIFIRELTHLKVMELSLMALMLLSFWQQLKVNQNIELPSTPASIIAQAEKVPGDQLPDLNPGMTLTNQSYDRVISNGTTLNKNTPKQANIPLDINNQLSPAKVELTAVAKLAPKDIAPVSKEALLSLPPADHIETIPPQLLIGSNNETVGQYLPVTKKALVKIGMVGRSETNVIVTNTDNIPTDQVIATSIYRRESSGYSGGVSVGIAKGRWEYHLKFFYTAIQYQPIDVINVSGSVAKNYVGKKYVNFEFNTFHLPIAVRFNIIDRNQWKLFTSLGTSWNLVTQAFYHKREEHFSDENEREVTHRWIPEPIGYEYARPGFFQKEGEFLKNSYVTGNVGFGVERSFGGRWSAFVASRYAHTLYNFNGGFGPYKDNIHTLSFESGIIVTMTK